IADHQECSIHRIIHVRLKRSVAVTNKKTRDTEETDSSYHVLLSITVEVGRDCRVSKHWYFISFGQLEGAVSLAREYRCETRFICPMRCGIRGNQVNLAVTIEVSSCYRNNGVRGVPYDVVDVSLQRAIAVSQQKLSLSTEKVESVI